MGKRDPVFHILEICVLIAASDHKRAKMWAAIVVPSPPIVAIPSSSGLTDFQRFKGLALFLLPLLFLFSFPLSGTRFSRLGHSKTTAYVRKITIESDCACPKKCSEKT